MENLAIPSLDATLNLTPLSSFCIVLTVDILKSENVFYMYIRTLDDRKLVDFVITEQRGRQKEKTHCC